MTGRALAVTLSLALFLGMAHVPTAHAGGAAEPPPAPPATATDAGAPASFDAAPVVSPPAPDAPLVLPTGGSRSGREIYQRFRDGLADPVCEPDASERWRGHFAHIPTQMSTVRDSDVLPLFGYVVDALRESHLPTEFALIPFVESGYRPGARSASGPAGLWQFIGITARNHRIPMHAGYDGRLSPVDSTRAAVRYLETLHGMFAGDWRLAVMAFNAGENRVRSALKTHGQRAMDARPDELSSLPGITRAYVRKLHALSCLLAEADDRDEWMRAIDRPVARLGSVELADGARSLDNWAAAAGQDAALVTRLNPALARGRIAPGQHLIAPLVAPETPETPKTPAAAVPPTAVAN